MEIYLLRHAMALPSAAGGRDSDRSLSEEGRKELSRVLGRAREFGSRPSLIISSPYLRAMQTARSAAEELGYQRDLVTAASLTPDSTPLAVWQEVRLYPDEPSILLVGHEPLLSATAAWMQGPGASVVAFRPAGMVCLDFETLGPEPRGVIRWDFRASH
jgi:phosphohistidine phosphatase